MSKSLGNAIGIHEAPLEMYGKVMSISDHMMWRYYELLTDVADLEILTMRTRVKAGTEHPMLLKKRLAKLIVADFHGKEAAERAADSWANQFQSRDIPEDIEEVEVRIGEVCADDFGFRSAPMAYTVDVPIKVDRLLARSGLASSNSEGMRKIKERAVKIDGRLILTPIFLSTIKQPFVVRIGKKIRRVRILPE
jgi:tyrosyl-tRNA synthetase